MTLLSLSISLLSGCSGPAGIWLVQVAYDADAGVECGSGIVENFEEGYVPDSEDPDVDSEWTYEQNTTGTDTLMFAQIETTAAGEAVLVMGGDVIPGMGDGATWTFSWTEESGTEDRTEHEDGYTFVEASTASSEMELVFTLEGDLATGQLVASSTESLRWSESDEWDDSVGVSFQIPSEDYLVYEDGGDEYSQRNEFDEDDCEGDICRIEIVATCEGTNTFTATRTDYQDEDAYSYLQTY